MVLQVAAQGQMASATPLSTPPCSFRGSTSQLSGSRWCVRQPQRGQLQVRARLIPTRGANRVHRSAMAATCKDRRPGVLRLCQGPTRSRLRSGLSWLASL